MSLYYLYGLLAPILFFAAAQPGAPSAAEPGIFELFVDGRSVPVSRSRAFLSRPSAGGITFKEMVLRPELDSSRAFALVIRVLDDDLPADCIPKGIYFERGLRRRLAKKETAAIYNKADAFYWQAGSGPYYSRLKSRGWATIQHCREPRQLVSGCFNLDLMHLKTKDRLRITGCYARIPFRSFLEK